MGLALDIIFIFFVMVCLGTIIVTVLFVSRIKYNLKSVTGRNEKNISRIIQSFLPDESNNTGDCFVHLIDLGFFATLKTDNHSKTFNDKKHLKDFRKNLTPENAGALRKIGEIYGRYYV